MRQYFIVLVSALMVSLVVTPLSIRLARRFGAMDLTGPRKVHTAITPRWGGIGIFSGFLLGLFTLWYFSPDFSILLGFKKQLTRGQDVLFTLKLSEQLAGILFGAALMFVLGLVDDRRPVRPGMKFALQVIAAYVAMIYGVRIYGFSIPGFESYAHFPLWTVQMVTVLWLVGMTNAINLIDGLDGLSGGVAAIVAGAFLAVALLSRSSHSVLYQHQIQLAGVIAAALLGGVLGFLVFNFYPARVFMGDCGSLSLGFLVGCVAVIGTFKTTIFAVLIVPFLLVAVPVTDMTLAFGRRLWKRKNPFQPDRGHLHHFLVDRGWTQREVVLLVYVITLVLAMVSVTLVGVKRV